MFRTTKLHDPAETMRSAAPSVTYVDVTPATAERWLTANTVNRNIRQRKVDQYAADMLAGRWTASADMICFSPDGLLLNGQHRLHAVVQSGCTITFAVQRNTPREAMSNMDTGASRKISDVLAWQGEKNAALLGAAAKILILITDGRIYKTSQAWAVSHGEIQDFIDLHPQLRESVRAAGNMKVDCTPSALATAHFLISASAGLDAADEFYVRLETRVGEPEGSAVLALDRRLREIRRMRAKYSGREYVALIVKAWNYDAKGQSVSKFSIVQRGEFRIPEVVVPGSGDSL